MTDILQEFLSESQEGVDQMDLDFLALEKNPSDIHKISAVLRILHTIKGTSALLGFTTLERLAHAGEGLLDCLRVGECVLNAPVAETLLGLIDCIREQLLHIGQNGVDGGDYDDFIR